MEDLTTRIKCGGCNKQLLPIRFSETARKKYREALSKNQRNSSAPVKLPRCVACNPPVVSELTCVMCEQTMALDAFARTQRRKPDDAHCKDCSQEKVDREAVYANEVQEVKITEDIKRAERMGATASYYSSAASRTRGSRQSVSDQYETATNSAGDWADGNDALSFSGSDNTRASSASTRITTGTGWDGFEGDGRPHSARNSAVKTGNKGNFAKQNAVGKGQYQKAQEQFERERRRREAEEEQVERADSDDDSEADDVPY